MKKTEKNMRDTKQRRLVYEAVTKRRDHPGADTIYLDLHAKDNKISKATVYRNLKLLSENGDIQHIEAPGADRYDVTVSRHYHIVCSHCGKMIDAPIPYYAENDSLIENQTGFKISGHRTLFEGICPECLKSEK